jgi:hypothetical protein
LTAECDLMARIADLRPRERRWDGAPFTSSSTSHGSEGPIRRIDPARGDRNATTDERQHSTTRRVMMGP